MVENHKIGMTKKCPTCNTVKSIEAFQKNRCAPDGLQWHCKLCRKVIDSRPEKRAQDRARYHTNKDQWLDLHLKNMYGISLFEYKQVETRQNGVCAICQKICASGRKLAVDHCHATGRFRGLLCGKCNQGIGLLQESSELMKRAINYLKSKYATAN